MSDDVRVSDRISIPAAELEVRATRSGGPGGQHVNTSATRIELRWNVRATQALSAEERERVLRRLAPRLDGDGVVRVVASEHRSQRQNRDAAARRLGELVRRALVVRTRRVRTTPPRRAKEARLASKKRLGEKKRLRRRPEIE